MGEIGFAARAYGRNRRISAAFGWLACGLIVLAATVWFSRASWATAQTSTIHAVDEVSAGSTHYRAWVIDAKQSQVEKQADGMAAAELLTTAKQPVQAGKLLELVAFVHNTDGTPVDNAEVVFEWRDQRGKVLLRDSTDYRGVAHVRRWVARGEQGHTTTVKVDVSAPAWSNQRWVWFVPR